MPVIAVIMAATVSANPRVFPEGTIPNDKRLSPPKDLNGFFPFNPPKTLDDWKARSDELKTRVLVANGIWPMPERTPLNPVIHGKVERDGFTVEKVYFESFPGHFVTGLLFRPVGYKGKRPGVLCPHGHGGRLQDHGSRIHKLIAEGQERFEGSGRFPKIARCAHLARMGCVTLIIDMLGYADSKQISYQLAHRFAKQRPEFESKESWGFYSAQAELRLQSIMGVQTWNAVRAMDFLEQLPDVDKNKLAVTGGSGGGTQTILLGAIDDRHEVAFPQGMVSTSMQGGCTCENTSLLRIGTGNVELTALFAPRPQGMTAANDWTKGMMTKGYPFLQQLYSLYGKKDQVICKDMLHFPHNYNAVSRMMMYSWFNKHLKLGHKEPILEEDFAPLTTEEHAVWNADHPAPPSGDEYERSFTKQLADISDKQLAAVQPKNAKNWSAYRDMVGTAFETIIGRGIPTGDDIKRKKVAKQDHGGYMTFTDIFRVESTGAELPVVSFYPIDTEWNKQVVLWFDGNGKSALFTKSGEAAPEIKKLLDKGISVMSADLIYQGEYLKDGKFTETPTVSNRREFAGYTHGYNHSVFAMRVHDILTVIGFVEADDHGTQRLDLVGVNGAAPLVAAARAIAGNAIDTLAIDSASFRFADITSYRDPNFLPGAVKYGDLPALLCLSAPHATLIASKDSNALIRSAFKAAGAKQDTLVTKQADIAAWLIDKE